MIGLVAQSPNPVPSNSYYHSLHPPSGRYRGNSIFNSDAFSPFYNFNDRFFVFAAPYGYPGNYNPDAEGYFLSGQTFAFSKNFGLITSQIPYRQDVLPADVLEMGDYLVSQNGDHLLIFQTDGNLCTYTRGNFTWSSGTQGRGANILRMQSDGNLCLYKQELVYWPYPHQRESFVWGSMSHNRGGFYCIIQDDGNFCVYTQGRYAYCPQVCWQGNFIWGTK
jgi:hypothetical protein